MRPGGTVVLLPQHPQVNEALGREIEERNAKPVSAVKHMPPMTPDTEKYNAVPVGRNRFPLAVMGKEILIDFPLSGRHQLRNLALAITAAEQLAQCGFTILPQHVEVGVRNTRWPGRFEVLPPEAAIAGDRAGRGHNPAGAWALRSALSTFYADRALTFIFGAMRDKAIGEMAIILFPLAEGRVIATRADNPRAVLPQETAELALRTRSDVLKGRNDETCLGTSPAPGRRQGRGGNHRFHLHCRRGPGHSCPEQSSSPAECLRTCQKRLKPKSNRWKRQQASGTGCPGCAHISFGTRWFGYTHDRPVEALFRRFLFSLFDRSGRIQHRFARLWSKIILRTICVPVTVEGLEKIDTSERMSML